jgi:hypothetical protein
LDNRYFPKADTNSTDFDLLFEWVAFTGLLTAGKTNDSRHNKIRLPFRFPESLSKISTCSSAKRKRNLVCSNIGNRRARSVKILKRNKSIALEI